MYKYRELNLVTRFLHCEMFRGNVFRTFLPGLSLNFITTRNQLQRSLTPVLRVSLFVRTTYFVGQWIRGCYIVS